MKVNGGSKSDLIEQGKADSKKREGEAKQAFAKGKQQAAQDRSNAKNGINAGLSAIACIPGAGMAAGIASTVNNVGFGATETAIAAKDGNTAGAVAGGVSTVAAGVTGSVAASKAGEQGSKTAKSTVEASQSAPKAPPK